ncbi:2-nitropropane dioxygenase [Arthrobacter oryzae]|uniref:2-nitropropane dioxygenase n=1 Tax=Arthrobacter oryzae TaxID=409290 RepID=UPI00273AD7F8|nr:2-nitropropane dioxygenase [Arthrobacter oryzae]WLQ06785.1 2-nitropropane dioxygenase [Arthrobacter oryzae]
MSTVFATGSAACSPYRRFTFVESAAARLGAALVRWAERRRVVLSDWAQQERAAALRREQLDVLRSDIMGAAHSGLYIWH